MSKVIPLPGEIVSAITKLLPGESVIYWTGSAGWISAPPYDKLIPWVYSRSTQEQYIFVQRKLAPNKAGVNQFEYIAVRRQSGAGA